jgi:hypothetical protein
MARQMNCAWAINPVAYKNNWPAWQFLVLREKRTADGERMYTTVPRRDLGSTVLLELKSFEKQTPKFLIFKIN